MEKYYLSEDGQNGVMLCDEILVDCFGCCMPEDYYNECSASMYHYYAALAAMKRMNEDDFDDFVKNTKEGKKLYEDYTTVYPILYL